MNKLESAIGYSFKNEELLNTALTHSSYANEHHFSVHDNERLEFLGDSILGFITAEYLYEHFKNLPEGELTRLRAYAVCEKSLFGFAKQIKLGDYINLSHGEEKTGGRERASVLSDAFEALIAAIYLDGGMDAAKQFVLGFIKPCVKNKPDFKDYKTTLQEVIQKNPGNELSYVLVRESGPDHDKCFEVEAHLNSNVIGTGKAGSKKKAEQEAAKKALELMGL